jgi:1-deoxy-D-xylulose-5-phosphate synthase
MLEQHDFIFTLEENATIGGLFGAVSEFAAGLALQPSTPVLPIGIPDRFMEHASRNELLVRAGLSVDGIIEQVERTIRSADTHKAAEA